MLGRIMLSQYLARTQQARAPDLPAPSPYCVVVRLRSDLNCRLANDTFDRSMYVSVCTEKASLASRDSHEGASL